MNENDLSEFVPQELAADQPNTCRYSAGARYNFESAHSNPADISEAHDWEDVPSSCVKKILTPFSSLILTNFSPDLAPVQGRQGGPQNIYQAGENSLMVVLEECLGATGTCVKYFQPAYSSSSLL